MRSLFLMLTLTFTCTQVQAQQVPAASSNKGSHLDHSLELGYMHS